MDPPLNDPEETGFVICGGGLLTFQGMSPWRKNLISPEKTKTPQKLLSLAECSAAHSLTSVNSHYWDFFFSELVT